MHKDDIHQLVKGGEKMKKRINCTHQHHHHHLKQLRRRRRCRRRIKCALESLSKISFLYSFLFKPLLSFVQLYCASDVDDHVYDFQKSIHRFQIDCLEYKQRYQIFKTCLRPQRPYNAKCYMIS